MEYSKPELIIGARQLPETLRALVTDYYNMYTTPFDELGLLSLDEALKMNLSRSQREVFTYVVNSNLRRSLFPQSGLKVRINGSYCTTWTVSSALKKLQEYQLVRTMNLIDYASFFGSYLSGRKPRVKFPNPLNYSLSEYVNYFSRSKGGSKAGIKKLLKHLGRMDKGCTLPRYSYARILYRDEPLYKRVFPKPDKFVPFQLYDVFMST